MVSKRTDFTREYEDINIFSARRYLLKAVISACEITKRRQIRNTKMISATSRYFAGLYIS